MAQGIDSTENFKSFTERLNGTTSKINPKTLNSSIFSEKLKNALKGQAAKETAHSIGGKSFKECMLQAFKKLKNPKFMILACVLTIAGAIWGNALQRKVYEKLNIPANVFCTPLLIQDLVAKEQTENDFDWNKNGKLDEDEQTAYKLYQKAMDKKHEEDEKADLLKKFDVNQDGKFDDVEKASMEAYYKEQKNIDDALLKQFDFDKDGKLNKKEKASLEAYKKAKKNN